MQACGLKPFRLLTKQLTNVVTPHAGVWIETLHRVQRTWKAFVTPHAGVWIETENKRLKK